MAWPVRYQMIALLFCGSVINYIDRVNISVAAPVIIKKTGWPKDLFGWVFSAFLIGYALLQLPGGALKVYRMPSTLRKSLFLPFDRLRVERKGFATSAIFPFVPSLL